MYCMFVDIALDSFIDVSTASSNFMGVYSIEMIIYLTAVKSIEWIGPIRFVWKAVSNCTLKIVTIGFFTGVCCIEMVVRLVVSIQCHCTRSPSCIDICCNAFVRISRSIADLMIISSVKVISVSKETIKGNCWLVS